ncbi:MULTISPECIES: hypothetical protein [unclassified Shewanella]|uniref:hypothetical protein n=1 Tax=unclassified Shewanella TaxID=196818 RepID=UPI0026E1778E|nr:MULTISPECIES: hypothetical protein [unclassified Shewanella]MDO6612434.1 hypothetical protein [Shewanella sp. 7_MG-2023]MDO6772525.1 hypothetical protein [Shewanella sp. 2_MG-2023]
MFINSLNLSSLPAANVSLMATQVAKITPMPAVESTSKSATASTAKSTNTADFSNESEFKMCELSEKSMRSCVDSPSVLLLLVILSSFALLPFIRPGLLGRLSYHCHAKPRRIHISLCRFQE